MEIMPYVISSLIALVVCTFLGYILPPVVTYILVGISSIFMIGLVLIQRGRGGGLAGAFGGVGGSSAFGTRAGDVFTRVTIVTASVWIALNMGLVVNANSMPPDRPRTFRAANSCRRGSRPTSTAATRSCPISIWATLIRPRRVWEALRWATSPSRPIPPRPGPRPTWPLLRAWRPLRRRKPRMTPRPMSPEPRSDPGAFRSHATIPIDLARSSNSGGLHVLLSMTGFGEAHRQDEASSISIEVRSVNGRHLKLSTRISEPFSSLEPEIERFIRQRLKRGTVQLNLRVESLRRPEDYRLNLAALEGYRAQLLTFIGNGAMPTDFFSALLSLPGVVETNRTSSTPDARQEWSRLEPLMTEVLDQLEQARLEEGRVMGLELASLALEIRTQLDRVAARVPDVVASYRDRLTDRVASLVQERGIAVEADHLIREVAIFAERSDIAEEITRLRAHLDQFDTVIASDDAPGRKLEFVVQEMGRETNTIGSKGNDVEISRAIVEMKGALEKIRELIQNIE